MPPHRLPPPPCRMKIYPARNIMVIGVGHTRACLKIHSRHLYAPLCGIFGPNSGYIAHYAPFIWPKSPTKRNTQVPESNFQTRSRACLKIHSRHLHAPLCGIFGPNSLNVAHYAAFIWAKSPTKCDAQLPESNFQTRSRTANEKISFVSDGLAAGR